MSDSLETGKVDAHVFLNDPSAGHQPDCDAHRRSFPRSTSRARTFWLVWQTVIPPFSLIQRRCGRAFYVWMQTGNSGLLQQQQSDTLDKQVTQIQKQLKESQEAQDRFRQQTVHVLTENSEKLRGLDRIDTSYWRAWLKPSSY